VKGPWDIAGLLAEFCDFPLGEHDDQVDCVSGAVGMLATSGVGFADIPQAPTEKSKWQL